MILGSLQLELHFPEPQSLKEKRFVLKSVLVRLRQKFNVSVAELDGMDLWQSSVIGIGTIGKHRKDVDRALTGVLNFFDREPDLRVSRYQKELL